VSGNVVKHRRSCLIYCLHKRGNSQDIKFNRNGWVYTSRFITLKRHFLNEGGRVIKEMQYSLCFSEPSNSLSNKHRNCAII